MCMFHPIHITVPSCMPIIVWDFCSFQQQNKIKKIFCFVLGKLNRTCEAFLRNVFLMCLTCEDSLKNNYFYYKFVVVDCARIGDLFIPSCYCANDFLLSKLV